MHCGTCEDEKIGGDASSYLDCGAGCCGGGCGIRGEGSFVVKFKIVSGGQTGVDRGGLEAASSLGLSYGGWIPKGRLAVLIVCKFPCDIAPSAISSTEPCLAYL